MTPAAPPAAALPQSPYRGIEPFRFVDSGIFFAREEETRELLRLVTMYRGVLVYGESGAGKSSAINAGFIPAALQENFAPERLRVQPRRGAEIVVERISASSDGVTCLPSLFAAEEDPSARVVLSAEAFAARLGTLPSGPRPVLIFDQFEEFETLFGDVLHEGVRAEAQAVQRAIWEALAAVLHDRSLSVKLVFVFREDYLAKLARRFAFVPGLRDHDLRLALPPVEAAYEIIRGPFERYPGRFGKELSPDLARRVAAQIAERRTGGTLNLSEVQIAALTLWQAPVPDALFDRVGGVQGLLEAYLADAIDRLDADLRDPAVALLSQLVTASGTRNLVSLEDLLLRVEAEEGIPRAVAERALEALERQARLVQREARHDSYFYEIVSEFLVPWISRQRVARQQEVELRRQRAELHRQETVHRWQLQLLAEQAKSARRLRLAAVMLVAFALAGWVLALIALGGR